MWPPRPHRLVLPAGSTPAPSAQGAFLNENQNGSLEGALLQGLQARGSRPRLTARVTITVGCCVLGFLPLQLDSGLCVCAEQRPL